MRSTTTAACVLFGMAICFSFLAFGVRAEQPKGTDDVGAFMQVKLTHSQAVLEGLTTEDYGQIAKHPQALSLLSMEASWNVLQSPQYAQRSADFRRAVNAMTQAAEKKNLDGATLAFVEVTLKCVECHKYVRSVQAGD